MFYLSAYLEEHRDIYYEKVAGYFHKRGLERLDNILSARYI